ncbi:uncharacterized protein LOC144631932 [Oculina patagonica]
MATDNLVYNSHGKKYAVRRERVNSISDLERGDHIVFHRKAGLYWHHAIVEYINVDYNEIDVIHYSNTAKGFIEDNFSSPKRPGIARVVRDRYKFNEEVVYLMKHELFLDRDTVVRNARSMLGEGGYNPFTNNCEHFAMWCKTGISSSDQVDKAEEMIVRKGASQAGQGFVERGVREGANKAFTRTASSAGQRVVQRGVHVSTNQAFARPAARAGQQLVYRGARVATNQALTRGACASQTGTAAGIGALESVAGGALIGAAIESVSVMHDIGCAHDDMVRGRITPREFDTVVGKRIITGTTNVAGTVTGMAIGQALIPVPVLGGLIGGTMGALVGSLFGNTLVNL